MKITDDVWCRAVAGLPPHMSATCNEDRSRITLGFRDPPTHKKFVDPALAKARFFEAIGGTWDVAARASYPHLVTVTYKKIGRVP